MDRVNEIPLNILFLFVLVCLAGCNQGVNSTAMNNDINTPYVTDPTLYKTTPTIQQPDGNTCHWPAEEIASTSVVRFSWSDDGNDLLFQKEDDLKWYVFSLFDHAIRPYFNDFPSTPTSENGELISPDKRVVVKLLRAQNDYAVYLRETEQSTPVLIGHIKGQFSRSDWIHQGKALILAMQWNARIAPVDAYVYMVDVSSKTMKIIIPLSQDYRDIEYLGVTPDEGKIIFTSYSSAVGRLRFWNIADNSSDIESIPVPRTFRWLNNEEFLAVGYGLRDDSFQASIYRYNISNGYVTDLLPAHIINFHPYIMNAVQISPNGKNIAYVDDRSRALYTIDCSEVVPLKK